MLILHNPHLPLRTWAPPAPQIDSGSLDTLEFIGLDDDAEQVGGWFIEFYIRSSLGLVRRSQYAGSCSARLSSAGQACPRCASAPARFEAAECAAVATVAEWQRAFGAAAATPSAQPLLLRAVPANAPLGGTCLSLLPTCNLN